MKNLLCVFALVALVASLASSQQMNQTDWRSYRVYGSAAGDTTENSATDTTSAFRVGGAKLISLKFTNLDRFSIAKVVVQSRASGATSYTSETDTLAAFSSSADGSTVYNEYIIRDGELNLVRVLDGQIRLLITYAGSGNDNKKMYVDVKYAP